MGYYISGNGMFTVSHDNLEPAYKALCELNDHDELKSGGSWGGENDSTTPRPKGMSYHPNKWFSWMDANYPNKCGDVFDILNALGFEIEGIEHSGTGLSRYTIRYENKVGDEALFLEALSPYLVSGCIEWQGEEGERWRNLMGHDYSEFTDEVTPDQDGSMTTQEGITIWK